MHVVYKITFTERKSKDIKPYYYIGSKSNCTFVDGKIYDDRGNAYYGSSSTKGYHDIVENTEVVTEIIKEFDNYTDALNYESFVQKNLDVVADPRYFNKAIAVINNYSDPNFATYKHVETDKIVRLPRNHHMVLSGEYVGVTKGYKATQERIDKLKKSNNGKNNPFYGKKHTQEAKDKVSKANLGRKLSDEQVKRFTEKVARAPRSEQHKKSIGLKSKNHVMLKNIDTLETIKVKCENVSEYDPEKWMNPRKVDTILKMPPKEELEKLIDTCTAEYIKSKYQITGNTLIKWAKEYGIKTHAERKKESKKLSRA